MHYFFKIFLFSFIITSRKMTKKTGTNAPVLKFNHALDSTHL